MRWGPRAARRCRPRCPWWSPPSQPGASSLGDPVFPRGRGLGSRSRGRRAVAGGRAGLGFSRLSGAQGPGCGVPSRRPRPRERVTSEARGGSRAAGGRGQRVGPGAGSCGAGSPLGDFRTSAAAPGARKPQFSAAHPAPGGRAAGRGQARALAGGPPQPWHAGPGLPRAAPAAEGAAADAPARSRADPGEAGNTAACSPGASGS